jgi:hypothetical protein
MPKRLRNQDDQHEQPATARAPVTTELDTVTPVLGGRPAHQAPPPKIEESPAFLFKHRPEDWMVMDGKVIPRLTKIKAQVGVNGIDSDRAGRPILSTVIAEHRERGVTVIDWDVQGPGTTYLRKPRGTNAVISQWERVYPGSSQIDCDVKGYTAFCRMLMDRRIVADPPVFVLERMEAQLSRELENLGDSKGADARRVASDLQAVRAELAEQTARLEPVESDDVAAEVA